MKVRLTLDANILVYALHADDPRHSRAIEIVSKALLSDCVQTLQSFAECFNALVRKRRVSSVEARERVTTLQTKAVVVAAQLSDLHEAMAIVAAHKLQFWDAMLWATARRVGCRLILSEDMQDGRDLQGVTFVNPFNPANRKLIDLALPSSLEG